MGVARSLARQARGLSSRVLLRLLADEGRARRIGGALGSLQRGRQALERSQEELMRALSLAPRGDFRAVSRQLSGLKRRLRELDAKLATLGAEYPGRPSALTADQAGGMNPPRSRETTGA